MRKFTFYFVLLITFGVCAVLPAFAEDWQPGVPHKAFFQSQTNASQSDFKVQRVSGGDYHVQVLPSGRKVKILKMVKMYFAKGDPALMLQYITDIDFDNKAELRKEAEDIWTVFRYDVEKAELNNAVLSASTIPEGWIIKTSRSKNFVVKKNEQGEWKFPNKK